MKKIKRAIAVTGFVATLAVMPSVAIAQANDHIGYCLLWAADGLGGHYCLFRI